MVSSVSYDCTKCPGYCCYYPVIHITRNDLKRIARHFGLGFRAAKKKFTVARDDEPLTMKRKADRHFGRVCQFFDTRKRCCSIYEARPSTCRKYPDGPRCGYYEFLKFERDLQDDDKFIATTGGM